ncbi:MAG: SIS domain-containing protein [Pseudomonadota bacterium]
MPGLSLEQSLTDHLDAMQQVRTLQVPLQQAIALFRTAFARRGRVFVCGNGGSAADAQHFAAEFSGRYEKERRGYPVLALTTDTSALTAIGNDYGYEQVFARQVQAVTLEGDVLMLISTSGNSTNLTAAARVARARGVQTIALLGRDGGALAREVDLSLIVPAQRTARIQEAHIFILHVLCEAFED